MNAPARLVAFTVGLVIVFALGLALGASVAPEPTTRPPVEMDH